MIVMQGDKVSFLERTLDKTINIHKLCTKETNLDCSLFYLEVCCVFINNQCPKIEDIFMENYSISRNDSLQSYLVTTIENKYEKYLYNGANAIISLNDILSKITWILLNNTENKRVYTFNRFPGINGYVLLLIN